MEFSPTAAPKGEWSATFSHLSRLWPNPIYTQAYIMRAFVYSSCQPRIRMTNIKTHMACLVHARFMYIMGKGQKEKFFSFCSGIAVDFFTLLVD